MALRLVVLAASWLAALVLGVVCSVAELGLLVALLVVRVLLALLVWQVQGLVALLVLLLLLLPSGLVPLPLRRLVGSSVGSTSGRWHHWLCPCSARLRRT